MRWEWEELTGPISTALMSPLSSLEELLTTQCDRFSQEEVSGAGAWERQRGRAGKLKEPAGNPIWPSFPDQEHVGCLPSRCDRHGRLQEYLLRHHTWRCQGPGVEGL